MNEFKLTCTLGRKVHDSFIQLDYRFNVPLQTDSLYIRRIQPHRLSVQ